MQLKLCIFMAIQMDLKSEKMEIKITRLLTVFAILIFSKTSAQSTLEQNIDEVTITSNSYPGIYPFLAAFKQSY